MSNDWKTKAAKAAKVGATCAEVALRFTSQLLLKLADAARRYAQA